MVTGLKIENQKCMFLHKVQADLVGETRALPSQQVLGSTSVSLSALFKVRYSFF